MNIDQLVEKWLTKERAGERAEYQQFLTEFCQAIDVPTPGDDGIPAEDYRFEAPVVSEAAFGTKGTHRIDLYRRNHFILEAKQSQLAEGEEAPEEPPAEPAETAYDLFGNPVGVHDTAGKARPRYDRLMSDARVQAERYALALPGDHKAPPFLIVCDIGRAFELYFDYSGNGRGYGFFPDQQSYRLALEDLQSTEKLRGTKLTPRDTLVAIWTDPAGIDPRLVSAEVTRDVAMRLSRVAERLEKDQRAANPDGLETELALGIEATSLFLMRMLFCMFAEDVGLLPQESFKRFLADARKRSDQFWRSGLHDLWSKMDEAEETNRYWSFGDAIVSYFNGNLFASAQVFDVPQEFKGELLEAAKKDWRAVEPAIFGTLLEQVLTEGDRSKLGAHYTPRLYVERLVDATIMDVLRPEWEAVRDDVRMLIEKDERDRALDKLRAFRDRLAAVRVLDPACGTGNFLYVAMEQLLRLEGEAIQLAAELDHKLKPEVHPNGFLGLELNPRAAVIAELVLWIGWLRHRLANHPDAIGEPVLPTLTNINEGTHGGFDAVLVRTATGQPDTKKPRQPAWPEAEFIVGNPPFIGGKDIRDKLGGDYAEALWAANPRVPKSADFVVQWWDRAAAMLTAKASPLKRFGLVTTNSITQEFSRRVIANYLGDDTHPLSLVMAIPDHPWTKATKDAAAVRIAMTVAEAGKMDGLLHEVTSETALDTDEPHIELATVEGRINPNLTTGVSPNLAQSLRANEGLSSPGVKLHGSGFIVTKKEAAVLGLGEREGLERHIRPYRNGRDLLQRSRDVMVIDLFGLDEKEVRQRFPEVYEHLLTKVWEFEEFNKRKGDWEKKGRKHNRRESYKEYWWIHGEPRKDLRPALEGLPRYIATVETSKHRIFQFLDAEIVPDNMLIAIGSDDAFHLGALQSAVHVQWALRAGGTLEDRPRYNKSKIFEPFPFPDVTDDQRKAIADLAEELDATRKAALAETEKLTMTELYNLREKLRSGDPVSKEEERRATKARAAIINRLHEQLDQAVAEAYGWGEEWKAGELGPSEIVARLVALNHERAAEEAEGHVRWLRPDYQIPRFGAKED
ncbi:DNA methyltransferase [Parasphingopyxis sp.]|uniref:class I SAM-dependent DNA methyltransferase n=1 Tax=Parasphingopyxis sp. TaxID=1920299 RepID=UPI00260557EA|nr:DNA methyltransferase [Parasphingopyxis sp.]